MTDQLTPGPELDARIATEVMGWRFDERWGQIVPPQQKFSPDEMWDYSRITTDLRLVFAPGFAVPGITYTPKRTILIPPYSTDIADAWRVVERFALELVNVRVYTNVTDAGAQEWGASIFGSAVHAATAPLAICRTALAVMTYINASEGRNA